jgi:Flp pilus assembly protein TadD
MKSLILILAAAALLPVAPTARADADAPPKTDVARQSSKNFEIKGDIARAKEEYSAAAYWYNAALRTDRKNAEIYNKLGIAQLKLGEMNEARRSFQLAVKYQKNYVEALNNLGATYCLLRKYKPAVRTLKEALALDEQRAVTHLNLAESWMGMKEIDRAMTEYTRALELDADILSSSEAQGISAQIMTAEQRAVVNFLIAKAYAKRGNMEGALDYLQRAKQGHYKDMASVYTQQEFSLLWNDPRLATIVKR